MSDLGYEHIANLFAIVKGNAEHAGKFSFIQDYAMRELATINDQLREKRAGEKKVEAEKAQQDAALKQEAGVEQLELEYDEDDHSVDPNLGAPRSGEEPGVYGSNNSRRV